MIYTSKWKRREKYILQRVEMESKRDSTSLSYTYAIKSKQLTINFQTTHSPFSYLRTVKVHSGKTRTRGRLMPLLFGVCKINLRSS